MTRQYIDLWQKWGILVYHGVTENEAKELLNALDGLGCLEEDSRHAIDVIASRNTGFTYSNPRTRMSIVALSKATTKGEYLNTIAHESKHVLSALCRYYDIDESSEEAAYLMGYVVMLMSNWVQL